MKVFPKGKLLNQSDQRQLITLLGVLQDFLESEIECHGIPPTTAKQRKAIAAEFMRLVPAAKNAVFHDPTAPRIVAVARKRWNRAEAWVKKLSLPDGGN